MSHVCALIRTFNCSEFVIECIQSIYDHVERICFIHSDKGWDGRIGNTCHQKILDQFSDTKGKLHHIVFNTSDQNKQSQAGIDWLELKNVPYDYIMAIDTDEVAHETFWGNAMSELDANLKDCRIKAFTAIWRTMIKSPFFKVYPNPSYQPVVFVHRSAVQDFAKTIRGIGLNPVKALNADLFHFTAVRTSFHEVWAKIEASCAAERLETVNKQEWLDRVWNQLPNSTDLHYALKWRSTWKGIKEITIDDLPMVMRHNPIVKAWQRYPKGCYGGKPKPVVEVVVPGKLSKSQLMKKYGIPEGFGPHHPDWKSKSKRNKYQMYLDELSGVKEKPVKLAIMTIVSGDYQDYNPMFWYCIKKEFPDVVPIVFGHGIECQRNVIPIPNLVFSAPVNPYTTAALRFVFSTPELESFDAVLITDIDMLMMAEPTPLAQQHLVSMRRNSLQCYDNYASGSTDYGPRCPGVHFVTKDWWEATREARAKYAKELMEKGARAWYWDEVMLYKIIQESKLPDPPQTPNLWSHHGIHLGDWRRRLANRSGAPSMNAMQQNYVKKLMADKEFLAIAGQCAEHLQGMKETLEAWGKI